ncbi:hypothetical protein [Runella aurantiaca]|uniref:Outer membrane protein beta-barrel domain-containing protein n=1 Tax=Runella aurantiaca TaxID=2282308 RepID=A0A369ICM2_9BACT|nr:hypothetical protein [Runella aurantiaca]RDB07521.1 hypothetical protein DVG78_00175 [Runella aurantiaca]
MKNLLIGLVFIVATLPFVAAQKPTARAPEKKKPTQTPVKKPTTSTTPAPSNNRTALPRTTTGSPNNATALPKKEADKTAAKPTSSGSRTATKLPSGGGSTTVTTTQPAPNRGSSASTTSPSSRNTASFRSSSRRSSGGYGFNQGDHLLNFGLGLGYSGYYSRAVPIGASYEYGITPEISIGAQFDIASASYYSSYYYYNRYNYRYTATYLGVRGSYHFNRLIGLNSNKLDLYAGVGLGYRNYSSYYDYYRPVFVNAFIGGKLYFSDSVGGFVELGYTGLSYSRVGLSLKF